MAMFRFLVTAVVMLLAMFGARAQEEAATTRQFAVPMRDGAVRVDELVVALAKEYELDVTGLALPAVPIDLRGAAGATVLFAARKVLLDTVRFRRNAAEQQLVVTIDRERTREVRRDLRARLVKVVGTFTGQDVAERRYALVRPERLDPARPLVVLVHGVEGAAASMSDLRDFLAAAPQGHQVATFEYPNDEAIDTIAAKFAAELQALGAQPVAIVAHSMGGLVARAVVENPAIDPGNVRTLVMLGTPNRGSDVASLRIALDACEVVRDATLSPARFTDAVVEHWRDGLGEAGGDLLPGSVFLQQMAARPRNPNVQYRLVLGTKGFVDANELATLRTNVQTRLAGDEVTRALRPRLDRWIADLDELVDGKGDGAVSVAAGQLDGVDAVLVPLDHGGLVRLRGFAGAGSDPARHPAFALVAQWLAQREAAPSRETEPSKR